MICHLGMTGKFIFISKKILKKQQVFTIVLKRKVIENIITLYLYLMTNHN